jgi:hypothetical protein
VELYITAIMQKLLPLLLMRMENLTMNIKRLIPMATITITERLTSITTKVRRISTTTTISRKRRMTTAVQMM